MANSLTNAQIGLQAKKKKKNRPININDNNNNNVSRNGTSSMTARGTANAFVDKFGFLYFLLLQ